MKALKRKKVRERAKAILDTVANAAERLSSKIHDRIESYRFVPFFCPIIILSLAEKTYR